MVYAGGAGTARPGWPGAAGFTLIELMIAISIFAILLVVGMPSLSAWVAGAKVNSMADFYLDGLRLARNGALQKSGASRFVLTANANGQNDWQVDWCFPTSTTPCDAGGSWSSTTAAATGDPNVANPSLSVFHSAESLPPVSNVSASLTPGDALAIYYNAQGWVNTSVQPFLRQLRFDAAASFNPNPATPNVRPAAIAINLSGIAERCDPLAVAGDSRACSP
jgi:type IV fimbrial biogenesis protein FimT